ncbi:hypothetical protein PQQ64_20500 [Paraburkholderia graminis]|uniref:hypothetical protein n=1 Tax=Paraburkholderia graminis TaxID=60548 RepID=UPI0038BC3FDF
MDHPTTLIGVAAATFVGQDAIRAANGGGNLALPLSRPPRRPDLIVNFYLTEHRSDGSLKEVVSGYRPVYKVRTDHWSSSAHHEFVDARASAPGSNVRRRFGFYRLRHTHTRFRSVDALK